MTVEQIREIAKIGHDAFVKSIGCHSRWNNIGDNWMTYEWQEAWECAILAIDEKLKTS